MRIFLAPMEGVVDHHFRDIYSQIGGIDLFVSEFIRVNDVPVPEKKFLRECPELLSGGTTSNGIPVRIQLLGSDADAIAASAITAVGLGAKAIDLNFGCPAKTVNKSRGGAILLKQPDVVAAIVEATRAAVPQHIPVTAKIRLGFEDRSMYLENALAIAGAGANELCVHARSRADGYNPPAYWQYIADIKKHIAIPVVANGEIWTLEDWKKCKAQSQCDDFMLGRGLLSRPDLALQIKQYCAAKLLADSPEQDLDQSGQGAVANLNSENTHTLVQAYQWQDICPLLHQFHLATKDSYAPKYLGDRIKQWLYYLQRSYPEAGHFFQQIKRYRLAHEFKQAFAQQGCFE